MSFSRWMRFYSFRRVWQGNISTRRPARLANAALVWASFAARQKYLLTPMMLPFIQKLTEACPHNAWLATTLAISFLGAALGLAAGGEPKPSSSPSEAAPQVDDPYLWLEDVTGERALTWVRAQNAISTKELEASPDFEPIRKRLLTILDSRERIPYVSKHGPWCYNFWRDEKNVRGLWRRTRREQ